MLRALLLLLAVCLSTLPFVAVAQTTTYYLCAILQGSSYISINQATLVVNSTTSQQKDYNGNTNTAYQVLSITSGSRSYTDLTVATPQAAVVNMRQLSPPGSTGGNTNLFFPSTQPQMLNGDGLTFDFESPISVAGQTATGTQMNLWWASGSNSLDEEVQGSTHETAPLQSTLIISQTQPACTVPNYAQFSMCLLIVGNGYSSTLYGLVNTTGRAAAVAPSTANGLSGNRQGWTVSSISGQRVYIPSTGSSTTATFTGVAAANTVVSNDNLVFPDYPTAGVFDLAGTGFTLSSAVPIAGGSAASTIAVKYANGQYYEQTAANTEATTQSFIGFTTYLPGTSIPPCQAIATTYQFCWSVQGSGLFSSSISGVLTINPIPAGTSDLPYYTVLTVTGTRVYTDYTTSVTTTNTITGLLPTGSLGGNDNKLFIGRPSQLLDGDGITVGFNAIPPIFGQNVVNQTTSMVRPHQAHDTPIHY